MKIQDIITENQAGVREGRLNEFAPGGSEGNGPFEYGPAIIQIGQDFAEFYDDEGAKADAQAIIKVGNTFVSAGMAAGIRAFYAMDTQVRDHVAEQLMDQGFNVRQDIYEPYDREITASDAAKGIQTILALLKEFSKTVEEPEDRKTVAGIYKAFQQGMKPGFVALRNAYEFDIDADFYDFARDQGVDLDQVAARAGFDTDSLLEVNAGVSPSQAGVTASPKQAAKPAAPAAGVSPSQARVTASPKQTAKSAVPAAAPVSTELNPIVKENLPQGLRQIADGIERGNFKSIQDVMKEIKFLADQLVKQSTGQGISEGRRR